MPDTHCRKAALRSALRQYRQSLNCAEQRAAAQALTRSVLKLPTWANAQRVALYLASDGEIDTVVLASMAQSQSKQLFLPILSSDGGLVFARWDSDTTLCSNRYNIPEPPVGAESCPVSELDLIFLPVVGWDRSGGRLGMGGGYYDRALSGVSGPVLVGLAHDGQQVEHIPQESWDIVLDYIATDAALYRGKGS
jgi:5-formyltetrahydrofolate cyclo-ligase